MPSRHAHIALVLLSFGLMLLSACGTYRPPRTAAFGVDKAAEIDDEDVRKAFEARPQLPSPLHVAYYVVAPEHAEDLGQALAALPGVASVYRIPSLMVSGERRFDEPDPWAPKHEISIKQLRLLAARARADVVVVFDDDKRFHVANGLVALTPLLLPILFVPFIDNRVETYLEAFVIDTRNGYLYGHVTSEIEGGEAYATIYDESAEAEVARQWASVRADAVTKVAQLFAEERAKTVAAPAGIEAPPAPPAPPLPLLAPEASDPKPGDGGLPY